MASWQITVRYGSRYQRYHTVTVDAPDVRGALTLAAQGIPEGIVEESDLVEVRRAVDPDERSYLGE